MCIKTKPKQYKNEGNIYKARSRRRQESVARKERVQTTLPDSHETNCSYVPLCNRSYTSLLATCSRWSSQRCRIMMDVCFLFSFLSVRAQPLFICSWNLTEVYGRRETQNGVCLCIISKYTDLVAATLNTSVESSCEVCRN